METVAAKLPKALVGEVNRLIRSGAFPNRSEVIRVAIRHYLATGAPRISARGVGGSGTAQRDARRNMLRGLAKDPRYLNRFVALHEGTILDHDDDLQPLVQRVLHRDEEPIFVERVNPGGVPTAMRGPGPRVKSPRPRVRGERHLK
ncbi:MAG TPA: ribbon-helix-helix domain-containing protein [Thermoplasmata archaeon]|jgi:Arc/MetJ-type ribon-helix-helix transcriptional regulator|nr:ribbon-helix-helix domain-containing protein [Thermoplasmata archaeon]